MKMYAYKIVLAGSGACGKSSSLQRFITGNFSEQTSITIGCEFSVGNIKIDGENVTLQIWDFGGEERFRFMLPSYCLGAKGCLLYFDLKRLYTFDELDEWMEIIREKTKDIPIILLGTKYDLLDGSVYIDQIMPRIKQFMEKYGIKEYYSISSKTGKNVKESFEALSKFILEGDKNKSKI